jgi:predicted DsbA family dithiol-disulfide isomerase
MALVEIFEDYLCSRCAGLERRFGGRIRRSFEDQRERVRIVPVAVLDRLSGASNYSTRCARIVLGAATRAEMLAIRHALFLEQPGKLSSPAAYSDERLVSALVKHGLDGGRARQLVSSARGADTVLETNLSRLDRACPPHIRAVPTVLVDGSAVPGDRHDDLLETLLPN